MSDSVVLSFRQVKSREEAMDLGVRFSRMVAMPEHADKLIHDNIRYFRGDGSKELECWLRNLLSVRLLYWPEYQLAAIVGGAWPEACMKEFGMATHEFQDATDPNYELDSWPEEIDVFQECKKAIESTPFPEYKEGDEEYQRRCVLYENIVTVLNLKAWMNETPTDDFEMMAFSGIYRSSQMVLLQCKARVHLKKWNDGMNRLLKDIRNRVVN